MESLENLSQRIDQLERRSSLAPRWLSLTDAAEYTSLSIESLRRLMAAGKIQPRRPVRGKVILDRLELDAFIASSTAKPKHSRGCAFSAS